MWQLYRKVFLEAGLSVPEVIPPIEIHPSLRESFGVCTLSFSWVGEVRYVSEVSLAPRPEQRLIRLRR